MPFQYLVLVLVTGFAVWYSISVSFHLDISLQKYLFLLKGNIHVACQQPGTPPFELYSKISG
jgi:hypothetical protein